MVLDGLWRIVSYLKDLQTKIVYQSIGDCRSLFDSCERHIGEPPKTLQVKEHIHIDETGITP